MCEAIAHTSRRGTFAADACENDVACIENSGVRTRTGNHRAARVRRDRVDRWADCECRVSQGTGNRSR